jgi:hypothetical protein
VISSVVGIGGGGPAASGSGEQPRGGAENCHHHHHKDGARTAQTGASAPAAIYDPTGTGRVLFAFFAAMTETERENIRDATLEGLNAAAGKGKQADARQ